MSQSKQRQARQVPEFGASLNCAVVPRQNVVTLKKGEFLRQGEDKFYLKPNGDLVPLPADTEVIYEGDPFEGNEHLFDLVTVLGNTFVDRGSALLIPSDQVRAAGVGVAIISRIPLDEFKRRARATIAGQDVVDFIDRTNWYQELIRAAGDVPSIGS